MWRSWPQMLIIPFGSADFHLYLSEDILVLLLETSSIESTSVLCTHAGREGRCQERVISPGGCRGLQQRCPVPSHQLPPRLGCANRPAAPPLGQKGEGAVMGTGWQAEAEASSLDVPCLGDTCPPPLKQQGKAKGSPACSPAARGATIPCLAWLEGDVLHSPVLASHPSKPPACLSLRRAF